MPRITFEGAEYEQYSYWAMGLIENGTKKVSFAQGQGLTPQALDDSEYAIAYDSETKSYSYEMAIPLSKTNITPQSEGMVFSMDLRHAERRQRYGRGDQPLPDLSGNPARGSVSGLGAGNFQHTFTNPLIVFTGGRPVTGSVGDTASAFSGNIALDGMVSAEEWGAPSSSPVQTIARIHGADSGSSALITAARCRRRSSM